MPLLQTPEEHSTMTALGNATEPFAGFRGSFSLSQTQTDSSPPRRLSPSLTSPSVSPSNQGVHNKNGNGLSPFDPFPNFPKPGPSLMDLSQSANNHQPVFSQNLDLSNSKDTEMKYASSSDLSDMIFNNQFSTEDSFVTWKPFDYNMNSDTSPEFLFGSDVGFFDIGFGPNDPQLNENHIPLTMNSFEEPPEKPDKEDVPDEGLVATFDPGTGDGVEETVAHSHPLSRTGCPSSPEVGDYLQLIQVDPLQARCEALAIAIFGNLENLHQQDSWIVEFFTKENIKLMLFLWARRWAQHVPVIHLPTFSILTTSDDLLFILCVIGKAYTRPGIDTDRLQWCIDVFNKLSSIERVDGELNMVNLEAVFILVVLCTWHGNKQQRDMAKRLYREVVDMARKYGYCQVLPEKKTDGSDEAEWKSWIERETRIR
jgi:hypothetical protein